MPDIPDLDPVENPVGFFVLFGVFIAVVLMLAAAALYFVVQQIRAARDRPNAERDALSKGFDGVEAEQRRLEEELKRMRETKPPPPSD